MTQHPNTLTFTSLALNASLTTEPHHTVRPTDTETTLMRRVFDALARMPLQCLTQSQLAAAMPYGTCPYDLARARAAMLADGTIALEGELVILL